MNANAKLLFEFLDDFFHNPATATLNQEELDEDFAQLGMGLSYIAHCFKELREYAESVSRGELHCEIPPPSNLLAAPIKSLHATLRHLTWQTKQVAIGDYKQKVDFMGEFAEAFNTMIAQLNERQDKLEEENRRSIQHARAMEQNSILLTNLVNHIPQQIYVISIEGRELLMHNNVNKSATDNSSQYLDVLLENFSMFEAFDEQGSVEIHVPASKDELDKYLSVNLYPIEWNGKRAIAMVVDDITKSKQQIKDLEMHAFFDSLTRLYNRFYGMLTFNNWIKEKRHFSLVFIDLDNLKYVNDVHGHEEGDVYIVTVANLLKSVSGDTMACRIGGDEFMLLLSAVTEDEANQKMSQLQKILSADKYTVDKDYTYNISYGIVEVLTNNRASASAILNLADEKMYTHKRVRKKARFVASQQEQGDTKL